MANSCLLTAVVIRAVQTGIEIGGRGVFENVSTGTRFYNYSTNTICRRPIKMLGIGVIGNGDGTRIIDTIDSLINFESTKIGHTGSCSCFVAFCC